MEVVHERCCGLDVHKQTIVACVIVPGGRLPHREVRTFGTMTAELLELVDWLASCQVTHVAMESTGVYWQGIWNLLEGQVELLLVNAHHVKQVPGRKTDVKDCEWLADLLRHGLLRASFVPPRPQRELRELTRYRTSLIRERAAEVNPVQKTLEGANINYESAGKRKKGKTRKGSKFLRRALTEAARAAARKRGCYPAAQYRRLVGRLGPGKAAVAVGHTLLVTVYYLLLRRDTYRDVDPSLLDERLRKRTRQRALAQLHALGYDVTLTEHQPAA
jgi:transposase